MSRNPFPRLDWGEEYPPDDVPEPDDYVEEPVVLRDRQAELRGERQTVDWVIGKEKR